MDRAIEKRGVWRMRALAFSGTTKEFMVYIKAIIQVCDINKIMK